MEKDCIFCRIVSGEIPSEKVYEDGTVTAFKDINPVAPVHILVIPNRHIPSLAHVQESDRELLGHLLVALTKVATSQGLDQRGYRVVVNTGQDGGQAVGHIHFHLLGGRSMAWPPG
ncbi:MAG TPA: histidine triad nucleotide-binding protein [Limnochordia bacterium]|nr:histidine triad nucleotide-binding protein [Limnochordia bacterium]